MKDNYDAAREAAQMRFCGYDMDKIAVKDGVFQTESHICTTLLGQTAQVDKATGRVTLDGRPGDYCESLTVFDWLCDRRADAKASYEFCPITSLPGIFVGGNGLMLNGDALAKKIDTDPEAFCRACEKIGGFRVPLGDIGYQLLTFPDLPVQVKFYHSDEEFPPSMTLLWDKNILQFLRYETIYYLARCLLTKLEGAP